MSKHPGFSAELLKLCGQMRDQTITPPEAQRLSVILLENKQARRFYLQFMSITAALETQDAEAKPETESNSSNSSNSSDSEVGLLLYLLRMEQDAVTEPVHLDRRLDTIDLSAKRLKKQARSSRLDKSLALYIAGQAVRSKPAKWLAAAAMIALGVLLAIQFLGPATSPDLAPVANNTPPKPTESAPPILRDNIVATLTATHNAQWTTTQAERASARGSHLSVGSPLHAGTRLTLTAGFAEITTARGAIAIIEAPATIELLDNDNAIELHSGKLVGICETDSSKDFLVRTPHIDVADLGTRFGVDAIEGQRTEVHVIEGAVAVRHPEQAEGQLERLEKGQAVQASADTQSIQPIEMRSDRFIWARDNVDRTLTLDDRIEILSRPPASLLPGQRRSASKIFLLAERTAVTLADPLTVIATKPGSYYDQKLHVSQQLPIGTNVDSYMLHMDAGSAQSDNLKTNTARYTFDRPILGVIGDSLQLQQTDALLGSDQTTYPTKQDIGSRGIEDHYALDRIHIEPDGRTIVLELNHRSDGIDQVRVLVQAAPIIQ